MKNLTQLTVGVVGGALLALLYQGIAFDRRLPTPADVSSDFNLSRSGSERAHAVDPTRSATEAEADGVPAEYRSSFASVDEWAFVDPAGFFAHAEAANSIEQLITGLDVLIATDPARVFEIAARFWGTGSSESDELYLQAIKGMVRLDPYAAIARLEGIAAGPRRDPVLAAIGEAYASLDADAALQWAASLMPPSSDALDSVIETVAATDLVRAYELLQQVADRVANTQSLGFAMARAALAGGQVPASVASDLVRRREPNADIVLRGLMQDWMLQEPERVVAWMNGNEPYLTDDVVRATISRLAFDDITVAVELTSGVPVSAQSVWLDEVALRYGQFDIDAALQWLPQFASRAGYTEILNRMLFGAMMKTSPNPEPVARFIAGGSAGISRDTVLRTGYNYAEIDPQAAVQWAIGLSNREYAGWAATAAVDGWGGDDAPAAQRWVLQQPPGVLRDQMLSGLLEGGVFYEGLDRRALVRAHTSLAAAQQSIYMFILRDVVNRRNVTPESRAQVEWMLDQLTDPELKRQAEERIAAEWEATP